MDKRTLAVAAIAVAVVGAGAVVAIGPGDFFLPEETTEGDGTRLATTTESSGGSNETGGVTDGATILASGSFVGVEGHEVSGTVSLVESDGSLFLQFENYEQTPGPDVFVYVTPSDEPTTADAVGAGTKVLIDGGEDGGESTKTGTFVQKLPDSVSADDIEGIAVWCEEFGVPFGYADVTESQ